MPHRNARLTVCGRRLLGDRVRSGRPVARVAAETGVSRDTAHTWRRSLPRASPGCGTGRTGPRRHQARVCRPGQDRKLGPARPEQAPVAPCAARLTASRRTRSIKDPSRHVTRTAAAPAWEGACARYDMVPAPQPGADCLRAAARARASGRHSSPTGTPRCRHGHVRESGDHQGLPRPQVGWCGGALGATR
ncbi:leucine zipper domain-containing protein [Streptomyces sp. NBC_00390]